MSDKPDKFFQDPLGVIHGPECPVTKAAWAEKSSQASTPAKSGPAQIATEAYRDGWSRIFSGHASIGEA